VKDYFFQVPTDWKVGLKTFGDRFFLFLLKLLDCEALLENLEDALS